MRVLRMIRTSVADLVRVLLAVTVQRPVGQAAAGVADDAAMAGPRFISVQVDRLFDVLALTVQIDHLLGHEVVHRVDAQPLVSNAAQTDRRRRSPLRRRVSLILNSRAQ